MEQFSAIKQRQAGVALISVLLVFAIIAVITAEVVQRQYFDIQRSSARLNSQQAYYYALAGEEYARQLLAHDYQEQQRDNSDGYADNWHQLKEAFDIAEGSLRIEIHDLQGRLNLGNLLSDDGTINQKQLRLFTALLQQLAVPEQLAEQLQQHLQPEPQPFAEQGTKASPERLTDPSELYLLDGMDLRRYQLLFNKVAALPLPTALNLNTLDPSIAKALAPDLTEAQLKQLRSLQQQGGYTSVSDWLADPVGQQLKQSGADFAVSSAFFEARIHAEFAGREHRLRSIIYRDNNKGDIHVINRQNVL